MCAKRCPLTGFLPICTPTSGLRALNRMRLKRIQSVIMIRPDYDGDPNPIAVMFVNDALDSVANISDTGAGLESNVSNRFAYSCVSTIDEECLERDHARPAAEPRCLTRSLRAWSASLRWEKR